MFHVWTHKLWDDICISIWYQYNMNKTTLEVKGKTYISSKKIFFTVSITENEQNKSFISLSVYRNKNHKLCCTTSKLNHWFIDENIFKNEILNMLFLHCDDDKVCVFYNSGVVISVPLDKMLLVDSACKIFLHNERWKLNKTFCYKRY